VFYILFNLQRKVFIFVFLQVKFLKIRSLFSKTGLTKGYNIFLYTCSNQNWMSSSKNGRNNSVNIKFWNRRQNFLTCCLASIFNILCDRHSKSLILPYVNPFLTKQFFTRVYCRNENMRERNWYEVCVFDCFWFQTTSIFKTVKSLIKRFWEFIYVLLSNQNLFSVISRLCMYM
jgi:hypothetical protein